MRLLCKVTKFRPREKKKEHRGRAWHPRNRAIADSSEVITSKTPGEPVAVSRSVPTRTKVDKQAEDQLRSRTDTSRIAYR